MNDEEWRPVVSFEGYEVSNFGRIRSHHRMVAGGGIDTSITRYLKPNSATPYPGVHLYKNGQRTFKDIHWLVAESFIGPRPKGMFVLHRDGTRTNNHVSNLYYGTVSDNSEDARRHGTLPMGERSGVSKLKEHDVREIRFMYSRGLANQTEIGRAFGIRQTQVSQIVTGKHWRHLL